MTPNMYKEIVEILLKDPRVDPSARCNEALGIANIKGYQEIVKMLLEDDRIDFPDVLRRYMLSTKK